MRMAGFCLSVPTQVNFELLYAPVDGRWRLFGLSVSDGVHWETHRGIASNSGADGTRWYYGALANCFANIMPGRLSDRLSRVVKSLRELKVLSPSSVLPRCFPERGSWSLRDLLARISK
jgi:hypothetical protein